MIWKLLFFALLTLNLWFVAAVVVTSAFEKDA
jgi:hypothetical protein